MFATSHWAQQRDRCGLKSPMLTRQVSAPVSRGALLAMITACTADSGPTVTTCSSDPALQIIARDAWDSVPSLRVEPRPIASMNVTDLLADTDWRQHTIVPIETDSGDVVAAGGDRIVRFNREGRLVSSFRGEGPTEMRFPTGVVQVAPDTFAAFDMLAARVSWHDAQLRPLRSRVLPYLVTKMQATVPVGVTATGDVVLRGSWAERVATRSARVRPVNTIAVISHMATEPKVVARVPGMELAPLAGTAGATAPVLLGQQTHVAMWGKFIAIGDAGAGYRVALLDPDGHLLGGFCTPVPLRSVTSADRVALGSQFSTNRLGRSDSTSQSASARFESHTVASTLPPYERFFVTKDQVLWIVDALAPTDTSWSATAYAPPGAVVARLHGSGNVAPSAILSDRVLYLQEDSNGFLHWRAHPITPPPPPPSPAPAPHPSP